MRPVLAAAFLLAAAAAGGLVSAPPSPALAQSQAAQSQAAKPRAKPRPKQVFPYWENYLRIPAAERGRFQLAYRLLAGDRPVTDLQLFAVDGGRRERIAIDAEGRMRPPSLDFFRSRTAVIEAPGALGRTVSINMEVLANVPPAPEIETAQLAATLTQANAAIRKAAGPLGLVAPKMARVVLKGAGSGEAVDAQGRRTPLPVANGSPYFQPAAMPTARRLVLAQRPSRLMLGPALKKKG